MPRPVEEHEYFRADGQTLADHNLTTGVLKLSPRIFSQGELEFLASSLKYRPTGSGLGISMMPFGTVTFYDLKEIKSMALEEVIYDP
jgi:hypothetical protein